VREACGEPRHLAVEVEAVHVQHVGRQLAQQPRELGAFRERNSERQEAVVHAVALELPAPCARLQHGDCKAGAVCALGDIGERAPRTQQFLGAAAPGVREEPDLNDARHGACAAAHRLSTRGSHWRISLRDTRSSHGLS